MVLADVIVKGLRVRLTGSTGNGFLFVRHRGIGGLRSVRWLWSFGVAWLVISEPLDVNRIGAASLFLLYQPLPALVPRRSAIGIHVTKSAVFGTKLFRLSEQRGIAKCLSSKRADDCRDE